VIGNLLHWSFVALALSVFALFAIAARMEKRRARRYVRPVPPGRGNARLARDNARFRTGAPR
jgi:hypothetical protein